MKCVISRTSTWGKKPHDDAAKESVPYWDYRTVKTLKQAEKQHWYQDWYDNGTNHREDKASGCVVCETKQVHNVWTIEVDGWDGLMKLVKEHGKVIVGQTNTNDDRIADIEIEIYDGYRE